MNLVEFERKFGSEQGKTGTKTQIYRLIEQAAELDTVTYIELVLRHFMKLF